MVELAAAQCLSGDREGLTDRLRLVSAVRVRGWERCCCSVVLQVELLRLWTKTAESDLLIAEALLGSRLSSLTTLDEGLTAAFVTAVPPIPSCLLGSSPAVATPGGSSTSCLPVLVRPVSAALLNELQTARGLAPFRSLTVKQLAAQVGWCDHRFHSLAAVISHQSWSGFVMLRAGQGTLRCAETRCRAHCMLQVPTL